MFAANSSLGFAPARAKKVRKEPLLFLEENLATDAELISSVGEGGEEPPFSALGASIEASTPHEEQTGERSEETDDQMDIAAEQLSGRTDGSQQTRDGILTEAQPEIVGEESREACRTPRNIEIAEESSAKVDARDTVVRPPGALKSEVVQIGGGVNITNESDGTAVQVGDEASPLPDQERARETEGQGAQGEAERSASKRANIEGGKPGQSPKKAKGMTEGTTEGPRGGTTQGRPGKGWN